MAKVVCWKNWQSAYTCSYRSSKQLYFLVKVEKLANFLKRPIFTKPTFWPYRTYTLSEGNCKGTLQSFVCVVQTRKSKIALAFESKQWNAFFQSHLHDHYKWSCFHSKLNLETKNSKTRFCEHEPQNFCVFIQKTKLCCCLKSALFCTSYQMNYYFTSHSCVKHQQGFCNTTCKERNSDSKEIIRMLQNHPII